MLKKSPFFNFLSRGEAADLEEFLGSRSEGEDYIDWSGFVLPAEYDSAETEYLAIRNNCAIFDISPMRKYRIRGASAGRFLDRLLTRPASSTADGRGIYVIFCNSDGSLKDDAILHKLADDDYFLFPSDIDHSAYFEDLGRQLEIDDLHIVDCSADWVGLAVQGPGSAAVLQEMGFDDIEQLAPSDIRDYGTSEGVVRVVRMGFTADLGYEIWLPPRLAGQLEEGIVAARQSLGIPIPGYGLTSLQACRLEGGFIVAGWDCATEADPDPGFERSPFELGLDWLVKLDGGDFVGREALLAERDAGSQYVLRSFAIEHPHTHPDRTGLFADVNGEKETVGFINSSAWSWNLGRMIGNASIHSKCADLGEAWLMLEGERVSVQLSKGPLCKFPRSRQVPAALE